MVLALATPLAYLSRREPPTPVMGGGGVGEGKPGEETGWFRDKEGKTTDKGGKPPKRAEMRIGGKMVGKWKKL